MEWRKLNIACVPQSVYVCVCERERERGGREGGKEGRNKITFLLTDVNEGFVYVCMYYVEYTGMVFVYWLRPTKGR
ncbi:hypothetical protein EJ05DRAFT_230522 [Pseudovirgaria hyperparasitica]|uniref:Uncharacterized protein n=1 Tax=Pseudovirgaria hyperparasitica TaxID=470096 RepID=A0A6A6VQU3_9PEZI|nr:uncharacterized protein EJ05DRAFT_230522 [Pseudovirgaria hyperparasitica]KAF2753028.1 hypothetical protein EJ05DRAFT_230522 [Pseudovirgaria hyperparasitica]